MGEPDLSDGLGLQSRIIFSILKVSNEFRDSYEK